MWDWIEIVGYVGTTLTIAAWSMRNCLHLRLAGAGSSLAFLSYGLLSASYPIVVTELILLPLNLWRLAQLRRETRQVPMVAANVAAERGWFLAHAPVCRIDGCDRLIQQGAAVTHVHLVVSGHVAATGGTRLAPGSFIGLEAVFADGPACYGARILGHAEIASLSLDEARRLFARCPGFAWNLGRACMGHPASAGPVPPVAVAVPTIRRAA